MKKIRDDKKSKKRQAKAADTLSLTATLKHLIQVNEDLRQLNQDLKLNNSKLVNANRSWRVREQRARALISGVRDYAIFMLDPNGLVAGWNEGARRLKGYEAEEIIGKHFSNFYPQEDIDNGKPEWELETARLEGRVQDEGWRLRKDGTRFWALVVITRVNDDRGNLLGYTKVTRDLTERKEAEEQLRSANESLDRRVKARTQELEQALRGRDEFLSIASHELKTPLTALKLQLQILERGLQKKDETDQARLLSGLQLVLRQVGSLSGLVEDLLDVSRIQTGRFQLETAPIDLSELTQEIADRFTEPFRIANRKLHLQLQPEVVGEWDRHRLEQVLVNLISNALKYAPGSDVHIITEKTETGACLRVKDFGPGISSTHHTRIFERYERGGTGDAAGGMGLGLFIVRRIVETHGGDIQVLSEPDKGAEFVIQLPPTVSLHEDLVFNDGPNYEQH